MIVLLAIDGCNLHAFDFIVVDGKSMPNSTTTPLNAWNRFLDDQCFFIALCKISYQDTAESMINHHISVCSDFKSL